MLDMPSELPAEMDSKETPEQWVANMHIQPAPIPTGDEPDPMEVLAKLAAEAAEREG